MVVAERLAWGAKLPYDTVFLHQNRFDSAKRAWARRGWLASCKTLASTVQVQQTSAYATCVSVQELLRRIFDLS